MSQALSVWESGAHVSSWRRKAHGEMSALMPACRDEDSGGNSWRLNVNPLALPAPLHPCPLQPPPAGPSCSVHILLQSLGQPQLCPCRGFVAVAGGLSPARGSLGDLWTGRRVAVPYRCCASMLCCASISVPIHSCL